MDAFVHASGDGFGNTAPLRSDTGAIDMDAISQVAHVTQGAGKLTRKEKKHAKREMKRRKKEAKKAEKEAKKTYSSIKSQLKDRDKELSDKMADARKKRDSAKDVVNYIGYNKMYQDGICEVEEGMFSSSIAFDDTSYHSVRDEQQKAMFSAITRLYDQFGADTLVQMSVINTPLLKEEVGHRKFFDPERQANDAARNDAQVFNNILNDKVKEGVSNIRRNRYLTYSVTADTAEDAARQLSRIEVESSRILNSIGSKAHLMNGTQRLSVIHSLLNPYKPFLFDYQRDISAKRLQTTKDCIAPTQIDFRPDGHYNDCVKLDNGVYAQVLVMKKFGSELSDLALADMADLPIPMAITWYVQPMDKSKAINFVRSRSAWIDKEIIEAVTPGTEKLKVSGSNFRIRHTSSGTNDWEVFLVINESKLYRNIYRLTFLQVGLVLFSIILVVLVIFGVSLTISRQFERFQKKISRTSDPKQHALIRVDSNDEFRDLAEVYNEMMGRIDNLIDTVYSKELLLKSAEIKAFQAQINPHFLYNTLDTTLDCINGLVEMNRPDDIKKTVTALASIMRMSIKGAEILTVRENLSYTEQYMYIEKIRYGDKLLFLSEIPESMMDYYMPKLIIQPLLENSIVHGISELLGKGMIGLFGREEEDAITFTVKDNGKGIPQNVIDLIESRQSSQEAEEQFSRESIGLQNIQSRIQLMYGKEYGLTIKNIPAGGSSVTIRLPKLTNDDIQKGGIAP